MNTIYIEDSAYSYLREWADEDRLKYSLAEPFFKKCEIRKKDYPECVLYVESKGLQRKFSLKINKKLFAKGEFFPTPKGTNDFQMHYKLAEENSTKQEQLNAMMTLITSYVHTNAFLWYGNFLDRDKREFSAVGKTPAKQWQNGGKVIVFRPFQHQLYAASVGHHRSPEGVFQVRGHFRRYKTGKVIWIDAFMKGVDKIDD